MDAAKNTTNSRWMCPVCSSPDVQIALPVWFRETRGFDLQQQQVDEGAEPIRWICGHCEAWGSGEPARYRDILPTP